MSKSAPMLSKSRFVAGVQCLKRLYWEVYNRDLMPPIDEASQAVMDQGTDVGELARDAFSGGLLVEETHFEHDAAVRLTANLIGQKQIKAIYEAAFTFDGIRVRVDVLQRRPAGKWKLIEVKSTTKVKDYHIKDAAIQRYVLEGSGINLAGTAIMHLNREYRYAGGDYDLGSLFSISPVDAEVQDFSKDLQRLIKEQKKVLRSSNPPDVVPGDQCEDPYMCPFYAQCHVDPTEDWIGLLPRLSAKKKTLLDNLGIESIHDIPEDFDLSPTQQMVVRSTQTGKAFFSKELPEVLENLEYPLFYMDFESNYPAIPRFRGLRPFDHYTFQWSVHVQKRPGGKLVHHEFLADNKDDPRDAFLKSLLDVLESENGEGTIVVYNQAFEVTRLSELAECFPNYASRINSAKQRIWDLLPVVRKNCYHPKFLGSFSIKKVLPALVPSMTYEGMDIGEGSLAPIMFERMVNPGTPPKEKSQIKKALLDYCCQDTLAMVRVIQALHARAH